MGSIWETLLARLQEMEWRMAVPEITGKAVGFMLGFAASWFLLFRRKLQELRRFQQGDSDEILFQMHQLVPVPGSDEVTVIFRNVGPKTTINLLYENTAARELVRKLADNTSSSEPILKTEGTPGFEVVNDALGYVAGYLSLSPFDRENWLFMMTCEDRQVVRKKCIRCFLIRPEDLMRFEDWSWCSTKVRVEKPWHAYRILALHFIALSRKQESQSPDQIGGWKRASEFNKSIGRDEAKHDRIRVISAGLHRGEKPTGEPVKVDWRELQGLLKELKLSMPT